MAFCAHCGNRLEDGENFCPNCGTRREPAPAQPEEPATHAPDTFPPQQDPESQPVPELRQAPPAGQPYAAQAGQYGGPEKRKRSAVKWIVLGGIAVVLVALALVLVKLLGSIGRAPEDINGGVYNAVSAELWGTSVTVEDVYPDGFSVELLGGGKCRILVGERRFSGRWELEADGDFHLEGRGLDCEGTLADGVMVLEDVMGSGVELTFLRPGAQLPAATAPASTTDPFPAGVFDAPILPAAEPTDAWCGDWYGWWAMDSSDATGSYAELDPSWWDCCASIERRGENGLLLILWDEDYPKADPIARVELDLMSYDGGATYNAVSREGTFWNSPVYSCDYDIAMNGEPYENTIVFTGYNEDDTGSFEYAVFLRPWGQDWSDVEAQDADDMPYYYDWYRRQVESGVTSAPVGRLRDVVD